jgi:Domain of unknown function (DUF4388)
MLLQGSIFRFNLASVLQFLAQNVSTGVLEVRDFEEFGFIYLVEGRVEGISLPVTDEKLGTRLVKAGLLGEQQLSEALMEDAARSREEKKAKPLGQRLIEMGYTNEQTIREVMARQTTDQVFELAHWQNGMFVYDEPEQMPHFQIAIQGNVQELLLDAYRRIDEGERARKKQLELESEVCYACPVDGQCTDRVRQKYLKNDVCLWREMGAVLDDRYDRVRDARQLYRSKDEDARTKLDASLDSE